MTIQQNQFATNKEVTVGALLQQAFQRIKRQNSAFSLRGLAKKLDISPAFLSKIFNDQASLPKNRIETFCAILQLDDINRKNLIALLAKEKIGSPYANVAAARSVSTPCTPLWKYQESARGDYSLACQWYYPIILDLFSCNGTIASASWIAKELGLPTEKVQAALAFLIDKEFLILTERGFTKSAKHLRLPTHAPQDTVRTYHTQVLQKAITIMTENTSPEDYARRLIAGVSVAVNPENLPRAIAKLHESLYEVAEILREGECTEVFQLHGVLFPTRCKNPKNKEN